jgi:two-component system OmpR family response regulator
VVPDTSAGSGEFRVLVVDDNEDAAESLSQLVRLWGYDCRVAHDGVAALETALDYQPQCLFLDIAMPRLDGCAVARRLRQEPAFREAKLVALTAFSNEQDRRRIHEAGFDYHLVKPADPMAIERLLAMLNEVLHLTSQTQRLSEQSAALARETKSLIGEARQELQEVKDEIREVKGEIREVKEEIREVKLALQRDPAAGEAGPATPFT